MEFSTVRRRLARMLPPRRMSTEERRRIQRAVANDPDVDRVLTEALAREPRFRGKGSKAKGSKRSGV